MHLIQIPSFIHLPRVPSPFLKNSDSHPPTANTVPRLHSTVGLFCSRKIDKQKTVIPSSLRWLGSIVSWRNDDFADTLTDRMLNCNREGKRDAYML